MEGADKVSVACQTEPNLIDKLIDNHVRRQPDDVDLYSEYVRSAQCAQFWPLDKNPIRALVPNMVKVDLPEQYLKNESLMFDLVQAITNNSKLVNLLAKYIHHIVPNVIISKRIDLIPLITCTIRVCRDASEQERLVGLLFNLIKRPNEEQRRMILSGIVVVLQVSPHQNSSLLLPNLWDHVNDKFPERRVLLAESCATLAHYVRPVMRTNLILSILIQLLKDRNAAVRSAACKSFACLLTLIMDRNDEVFDACLSATEDIIHDVLQQTPVNFCEHRYELEQMRFCALETIYPLLCMWAVKLNRFKLEIAEFYIIKADKHFNKLLTSQPVARGSPDAGAGQLSSGATAAAAAVARRRSVFFESRNSSFSSSSGCSSLSSASSLFGSRRQSSSVASPTSGDASANATMLTSQRAVGAYLKMLNYLVPFVFSDAVHSCAWLSKSKLHLPSSKDIADEELNGCSADGDSKPRSASVDSQREAAESSKQPLTAGQSPECAESAQRRAPEVGARRPAQESPGCFLQLFDRPLKFGNKLLEPTLIIDESAIVAFHDQLEQEHMIESLDWILNTFLPRFLSMVSFFSHKRFCPAIGATSDIMHEFLSSSIASTRQLCLLFGKHLTRTKIRPLIKQHLARGSAPAAAPDANNNSTSSSSSAGPTGGANAAILSTYLASLTSFEPIEQPEFEEMVASIRCMLSAPEPTRAEVEILAVSIKIIATNTDQIHSPSTRQKFLTYILDALVGYSNKLIRPTASGSSGLNGQQYPGEQAAPVRGKLAAAFRVGKPNSALPSRFNGHPTKGDQQQAQAKEFMLIIFRHILTCLVDPNVRPSDWAHILVTKFLPVLISLANDSADVYVCTYARLMCAQLVETFDTYLNSPKLNKVSAGAMLPALSSLRALTEQIKASNLKRQIDCLTQDLNDKFFRDEENNSSNNNITVVPNPISASANLNQ